MTNHTNPFVAYDNANDEKVIVFSPSVFTKQSVSGFLRAKSEIADDELTRMMLLSAAMFVEGKA